MRAYLIESAFSVTIAGTDFCTFVLNVSLKCSFVNIFVRFESRKHFIKRSFMKFSQSSSRILEPGDKTDNFMSFVVRKLNKNKQILLLVIFESYQACHFKCLTLLGILELTKKEAWI